MFVSYGKSYKNPNKVLWKFKKVEQKFYKRHHSFFNMLNDVEEKYIILNKHSLSSTKVSSTLGITLKFCKALKQQLFNYQLNSIAANLLLKHMQLAVFKSIWRQLNNFSKFVWIMPEQKLWWKIVQRLFNTLLN